MTDDLEKRLRAIVGDLPPRNHIPLAREAADALAAKDARIAELEKALTAMAKMIAAARAALGGQHDQ